MGFFKDSNGDQSMMRMCFFIITCALASAILAQVFYLVYCTVNTIEPSWLAMSAYDVTIAGAYYGAARAKSDQTKIEVQSTKQ